MNLLLEKYPYKHLSCAVRVKYYIHAGHLNIQLSEVNTKRRVSRQNSNFLRNDETYVLNTLYPDLVMIYIIARDSENC